MLEQYSQTTAVVIADFAFRGWTVILFQLVYSDAWYSNVFFKLRIVMYE